MEEFTFKSLSTIRFGEAMKVNNIRLLSVLLISFSLIINSCASTLGYKMGAKVNSRIEVVDPENYETIKKSAEITLYLNDKSIMAGKFNRVINQKFVLRVGSKDQSVKLDEINFLELKTTGHGPVKWVGLTVGLMIDYVLAIGAIIIAICWEGCS